MMLSVSDFYLDAELQYSRQSFQNRARLRTPTGRQWISAPIGGGQFQTPINDTKLDYSDRWVNRHLKALQFNYGSTPFFEHYYPEVESILKKRPPFLGEITMAITSWTWKQFRPPGRLVERGPLDTEIRSMEDTIRLCRAEKTRPSELMNLTSKGTSTENYQSESPIVLMNFQAPEYKQNFDGFEKGVSSLDLLFNHGPAARSIIMDVVQADSSSLNKQ